MMSTNIKSKENTASLLPLSQVLLAESDLVEIALIKLNIDLEFRKRIKIVENYDELLKSIAEEPPILLMLGRIDKLNYFKICQECHEICTGLPIVLLSKQEIINYSFLQIVKSYGVIDVISNDFTKVNQLLQALELNHESKDKPCTKSSLIGKSMLEALEEIVTISSKYFGTLAQGNYWRKSHVRAMDKFSGLSQWSVDHFSKFSCDDSILMRELTEEDIRSLQFWVQFFVEECERIIVDYREILDSSDISSLSKTLLIKPQ